MKFDNQVNRDILKLALPLTVGSLSQMALTITDSIMIGNISYTHLAASSFVSNYVGIPYVACIGLTTIIAPLVAYQINSDRRKYVGNILASSLILNSIVASLLCLTIGFSSNLIDKMGQEEQVVIYAKPFLFWINWSILPMIIFLTMKQFSDGMEKTRVPLIISIAAIPLNVLLNYIFIYGFWSIPRMELEGAGIATFLTRCIIAIVMTIYILYSKVFDEYRTVKWKSSIEEIKRIGKMSLPSAWQYASEIGAFAILAIIIGWFGAKQLAAHQIAISIAAVTFMISVGLASAGSIKVGEYFGAGDIPKARIYGLASIRIAILYGVFCALCFVLLRHQLPLIFTDEPEVLKIASGLLILGAVFQISDSVQAVAIGILRGMQDIKYPTIVATISYWLFGIPVGYILACNSNMRANGVWIGFITCLTLVSVFLYFRFNKLTK